MVEPRFTRDDIKPCALCGQGIMKGSPLGLFWRINAERMIIDRKEVQREAGLEMMLGGNVALARAFSPNKTLAKSISTASLIICEPCAIEKTGSLPAVLFCDEAENG